MPEKLPPLPKVSILGVLKLRDKIRDEVAFPFYEDTLSGRRLDDFAAALFGALEPRGVEYPTIVRTCELLAGKVLAEKVLAEFAWRVAGNLPTLKAGEPLRPPAGVRDLEWIPLQVLDGIVGRDRFGNVGCDFTFKALAGSQCPAAIPKFWRRNVYDHVATMVGFSPQPWGATRLSHPTQLVGLRLFGLSDPIRAREGRPDFHQVAASASMLDHNRRVIDLRYRKGRACPFGLDGERRMDCHRCPIGYRGKHGEAGCRAATHPARYAPGTCPGCKKDDMPFDPGRPGKLCVDCTIAERLKPKE